MDSQAVKETQRIIEAILFAAGSSVKYSKLSDTLSIPLPDIKEIVKNYAEEYNSGSFPRGIQLLTFDDSCQLCTKEEYEQYIRSSLGITKEGGNLSNSSLEVLAVIAYNQPVTRAFVEQVRGVDSSYAISVLTDRELIEKVGRLDVPGKPNLYATTDAFLRAFGLDSLSGLPQEPLLKNANEAINEIQKEKPE